MKIDLAVLVVSAVALSLLAGCEARQAPPDAEAQPAAQSNQASGLAAALPTDAGFSSDSVPVTTVSLPPFPFFDIPAGLTSVVGENEQTIPFDAQYFMAGDKPVKLEGRIYHNRFNLTQDRKYSDIEFHRNYENAIKALGGVKISTSQYTQAAADTAGGYDELDKYSRSIPPRPDYRHESYLIRAPDAEYWIEVSTGVVPLHGTVVVLEKKGMTQSVGFLTASQMKQELDRAGRVALYVNFDVDKATLRPDANPVLAEVNTLLNLDPKLKLSIEGHTDNTGNAQHNRDLSTARARSVFGALVGLGVDPARLQSKGFGPDKPIADNSTDSGRAKNRRVELVKS